MQVLSFMPSTTLKEAEWTKVNEIMIHKLGSVLWNAYLQGATGTLTTSEVEAIKKAELELYGSESARAAIEAGSVSSTQQTQIDTNIQDFIWEHRVLSEDQKIPIETVVPRMPYTRIRLDSLARVEVIKTHLIADLWEKKFVRQEALRT